MNHGHLPTTRATPSRRSVRGPFAMVAVSVLCMVALLGWSRASGGPDGYTPLAAPSMPPASSPAAQPDGASTDSPVGASAARAHTVASEIPPSRATAIYIPNSDPDLAISTTVQPLGGCREVIDPPRDGENFGGVFGCKEFAQPGTDSPGVTVLAGHSSKDDDTAFNRLYQQGDDIVGKRVFIRTEASGKRWLEYRIDKLFVPQKSELPYMTEVWGEPGASTAGRIIVVTCRQQPEHTPAVQNYVAVGTFVGVR